VLALLARFTPRPRLVFLVVTVVGLVLSFASPVSAAQETSTAVWLNVMHVVVFAAVVLPLARLLPDRKA
jgi:nicotinamide riboside transporter PnuC